MKLTDLKPKAAKFYLQHPVTLENVKDDNGEDVYLNVVGRDSKAYHATQVAFLERLEELGDEADNLTKEDYRKFAQDTLIALVTGWDAKFDDFMGGAYSEDRLREILDDEEMGWLTSQLDSFVAKRKNFFLP